MSYDDKDQVAGKKRVDEQWRTPHKALCIAGKRTTNAAAQQTVRRTPYKAVSVAGVPTDEEAMLRYEISATPTFVVIDKKGVVRFYSPTRLTE